MGFLEDLRKMTDESKKGIKVQEMSDVVKEAPVCCIPVLGGRKLDSTVPSTIPVRTARKTGFSSFPKNPGHPAGLLRIIS